MKSWRVDGLVSGSVQYRESNKELTLDVAALSAVIDGMRMHVHYSLRCAHDLGMRVCAWTICSSRADNQDTRGHRARDSLLSMLNTSYGKEYGGGGGARRSVGRHTSNMYVYV